MSTRSSGRSSYGPGDVDVVGGRIVAQIVDMIVVFVLAVVVGLLFGIGLQSRGGVFLGIIVATIAYGTVLEGAYGKTLGKMLIGIRVVGPAGDDVGYGPAFLRNIPALVGGWLTWIVGIAAIATDDQNQRLFDQFADTYVVRD